MSFHPDKTPITYLRYTNRVTRVDTFLGWYEILFHLKDCYYPSGYPNSGPCSLNKILAEKKLAGKARLTRLGKRARQSIAGRYV